MTVKAGVRVLQIVLPGDLEKKQNQRYRNRSGSLAIRPPWTYYPKNETEISQIIQFSRDQRQKLRPAGAGHAFAPLNQTDVALLRLDRFAGLVHVNRESREAIVWAGTRLDRLAALLADQGLALPYPAEHAGHTLAGALAVGAHGLPSGLAGMLAGRVTALTMVTGRGDIIVCSRQKKPEVFRAALLSLGALGVITKVSLNLETLAPVREEMSREAFDAGLEMFAASARANGAGARGNGKTNGGAKGNGRGAAKKKSETPQPPAAAQPEFIYVPNTDQILTRRLQADAGAVEKRGGSGVELPAALLAGIAGLVPALARPLAGLASRSYFRPAAKRDTSSMMRSAFASRFQMEYGLAPEQVAAALPELRDFFRTSKVATLLPLTLRLAPADDIYLSPAYGRATCFVTVRAPVGPVGRELLAGCEAILRKHGGRPGWGGFFTVDDELKRLLPGLNEFKNVRAEMDPDGVLLNDFLSDLFS